MAATIFRSSSKQPIHVSFGDNLTYHFYGWNHGSSYVGLLDELKDIRLLLDQRSEGEFKLMSYVDTDIIYCISPKVLVDREMWDANVSFIVYAAMEMHESDRVMCEHSGLFGVLVVVQSRRQVVSAINGYEEQATLSKEAMKTASIVA
ncbi:hypothetical protein PVK06_024460 [Gossypium arboreum]|uniref:Uncharacterized protein n=1 Tax=Gossypium arboreum TaxID=29729 RepID=A0ABR0PDZ5_GOSAR|nr:hypothetical protein PVK06_024460 [Gossypium arboreum]